MLLSLTFYIARQTTTCTTTSKTRKTKPPFFLIILYFTLCATITAITIRLHIWIGENKAKQNEILVKKKSSAKCNNFIGLKWQEDEMLNVSWVNCKNQYCIKCWLLPSLIFSTCIIFAFLLYYYIMWCKENYARIEFLKFSSRNMANTSF